MSNQLANVNKLKAVLNADSVQQQFQNALRENAGAFTASIIDLYNNDTYLQKCDPGKVVMEALKAATLKLPINKQLGFAYIVPYGDKPEFQIGYRGYVQLAMRTAQYKTINTGVIYEGMDVVEDYLSGKIEITGKPTSDKATGYFAHIELINGFTKTWLMTTEQVRKHAQRYSKSYSHKSSAWQTNFDEMAQKTCVRLLLSKYGIMTTEMMVALNSDRDDTENQIAEEISNESNGEVIDIKPDPQPEETTKEDPGF